MTAPRWWTRAIISRAFGTITGRRHCQECTRSSDRRWRHRGGKEIVGLYDLLRACRLQPLSNSIGGAPWAIARVADADLRLSMPC